MRDKTAKDIEREVLQDVNRKCLFNVAGPCFHPKCLEAEFNIRMLEVNSGADDLQR